MELQFLHSKEQEKEKLLDIYEEYQWFVNNNFPLILPEFYSKIYKEDKNNKRLFIRELSLELNRVYDEREYQVKTKKVENDWRKIEQKIFNIIKDFGLKIENKYTCYISFYGPQGQFRQPNIINLRVNNTKDIKEARETITHELIHLLIYDKVKKLKLNYEQTEDIVDLFFMETKLKDIFPGYKPQNLSLPAQKIFQRIVGGKN